MATWYEKAEVVIGGSKKKKSDFDRDAEGIARRSGVTWDAKKLSRSIAKKTTVNAYDGLVIARSLGVNWSWLFDPAKSIDQVEFDNSPESLDAAEVLTTVGQALIDQANRLRAADANVTRPAGADEADADVDTVEAAVDRDTPRKKRARRSAG